MSIFRSALVACALFASVVTASAQQLVYRNTFRSGADTGWSRPITSKTASDRSFLGPFTTDSVNLLLTDLPPHSSVTVAFSLFAIGPWAGSDNKSGPDIWGFGEVGAAPQVYSTFATTGKAQSYPGPYPSASFARGTWAFESNTLGYSADAVFRIQRTFTHSSSELLLEFAGNGERWGLDNVEVWVAPLALAANAWGRGEVHGQVGNDLIERQSVPRAVGGVKDVVAVSGGDHHSLALSADGSVWGWGSNAVGQTVVGNGPAARRITGANGEALPSFSAIASGGNTAVAIGPGGTVWAWGSNLYGQAGLGYTSSLTPPTQIPNLDSIVAVAAGHDHVLALRADGSLWTWGRNDHGQLGLGRTGSAVLVPTVLGALRSAGVRIVAIAAGDQHAIAVDSKGVAWGWGYNAARQVGDTSAIVVAPRQLTTSVVSAAAGRDHTLLLLEDGRVSAWGSNDFGQLGTGSTTGAFGFVQTASGTDLTGVIAVSASGLQSFAVTSDGVLAFGGNDYGQLGTGTYGATEYLPTLMRNSVGVSVLGGGAWHALSVGPAPRGTLDANAFDFGDVTTGSSVGRTITLSNTGIRDLSILAVNVSGSGFSVQSSDCSSVLGPGGACHVVVVLAPSSTGTATGALRFKTNTPAVLLTAMLSGRGVVGNTASPPSENEAPLANDQSVSVHVGTATGITLSAFDSNGDATTFAVVAGPAHGALTGTAPNLTYTPDPGYLGPDTFAFTAHDGTTVSNVATVTITVVSDNAVRFTAVGTHPTTGRTLSAEVTFDVEPTYGRLVVTLTNTSNDDVVLPSEVLTAVFFNVRNEPVLSPYNARLEPGSVVLRGPDGYGNIGGEWAYRASIAGPLAARRGISAANYGTLFGGANFRGPNLDGTSLGNVDDVNYGVTSAGDNPNTDVGQPLIRNSVVFQAAPQFSINPATDISGVSFQYGSTLTDSNLPGLAK